MTSTGAVTLDAATVDLNAGILTTAGGANGLVTLNASTLVDLATGQTITTAATASGTDTIILNNGGTWEDSTLAWSVEEDGGTFTYVYTFTVPTNSMEISHLSIQVSDDFNTVAGSCSLGGSSGTAIPDCTNSGAFDPTSPLGEDGSGAGDNTGKLFAIKLDNTATGSTFAVTATLMTDVAPVWGDFFAKDGQGLAAINSGYFLADPTCAVSQTNVTGCGVGFLAVPDSVNGNGNGTIPEPGTLGIFGLGLAGLGFARRKRMI